MTGADTAVCLSGKSLAKRAARERVLDHRAVPLDLQMLSRFYGDAAERRGFCQAIAGGGIRRATHTDA